MKVCHWKAFLFFIPIALGLFISTALCAEISKLEEIQQTIVQLYSDGKCDEVRKLVNTKTIRNFRPNIMAIAAYCEPQGLDPESIFSQAEAINPTGELILTLHAKYRWKKDQKSSKELWQKVLLFARNDYFRDLAKDYLADVIDDAQDRPLHLSRHTGFGKFFLGATHKTHPETEDFVYLPSNSSFGANLHSDLSWRSWYRFGSLAANAALTYDHYFTARNFNLFTSDFELPIAVHIVSAKDIVFRPFLGYSRVGHEPYKILYGLGVMGVVYKSNYKQSVQGIVFSDHVYVPAIQAQEGAHYRFEYQWDFFPPLWFFSTQFFVEHVSADRNVTNLFGVNGDLEMNHTDIGLNLQLDHDFPGFTLGFKPNFVYRVDSDDSTYPAKSNDILISKQRQDWTVKLQVNASVPLLASVQIFSWFEWMRVFSNIDSQDYIDRNYKNETVGLGIRTSMSTY